jgi:putative membrane protein
MNAKTRLRQSFNWRMLLMRVVVNMLALAFTALVVPKIFFVNNSLLAWVIMGVALGILNAVVKPIIQFLTLRFIFVTVGLVLVVINALMLYLLSWLMPDLLAVNSLLWAVVGGLVLGIVNAFLENLLGLSPPIVSEKYPAIRQRVQDKQFHRTAIEQARIEALGKITPPASSVAPAAAAVVDAAAIAEAAGVDLPATAEVAPAIPVGD